MIKESLIKSIYNYRYKLKKLNPNSEILKKKPGDIKSSKLANNYVDSLTKEIAKAKVKRLYKTNRKLALQKDIELQKQGSSKYYELKIQYEKEFNPNVKENTLSKLHTRLNKAKQKETGIRTNKYGLSLSKSEIKDFYKERDKANKKITKLLNTAMKNDRGLYDFINGSMKKEFRTGDFNPIADGRFFITKPQFKNILGSNHYKDLLKKYSDINNKNFSLTTWLNEGRETLLQVFNSNRYLNLDEKLLKEFNDYALNMDIPAFMNWYVNNKMKIEDYYLEGKYEMMGVSNEDLKEELQNVVKDMRSYQELYNKVYK